MSRLFSWKSFSAFAPQEIELLVFPCVLERAVPPD